MKIGILSSEDYHRRPTGMTWASRIRGSWLWENWPEAERLNRNTQYDAVIFPDYCAAAREFPKMQVIRIFDVHNPELETARGGYFWPAVKNCDAVSCSSPQIAEYMCRVTEKPVACIPDRLDLSRYKAKKIHTGRAKKAVWYGYASNQEALAPMVPEILQLGLSLTVISEKFQPEFLGKYANLIHFKPYDFKTFESDIVEAGDIALNPRLEHGLFRYKSNNKTLTAWALGLPVAATALELERFMDDQARVAEAAFRAEELKHEWDIRLSIQEFQALIQNLMEKRG